MLVLLRLFYFFSLLLSICWLSNWWRNSWILFTSNEKVYKQRNNVLKIYPQNKRQQQFIIKEVIIVNWTRNNNVPASVWRAYVKFLLNCAVLRVKGKLRTLNFKTASFCFLCWIVLLLLDITSSTNMNYTLTY